LSDDEGLDRLSVAAAAALARGRRRVAAAALRIAMRRAGGVRTARDVVVAVLFLELGGERRSHRFDRALDRVGVEHGDDLLVAGVFVGIGPGVSALGLGVIGEIEDVHDAVPDRLAALFLV